MRFSTAGFFGVLLLLCLDSYHTETLEATANNTTESIVNLFTDEEKISIEKSSESFTFQAEVSRLMDIIINSLYSEKDIFLRELLSNAADALEKARFMAISQPGYLSDNSNLEVRIEVDKNLNTLIIQDSGIGMTKDDLVRNLGTVARSGTTNFLEALAESGDLNLIGQFGVGFYSAFLVADKVTVISKHNSEPEQHIWESNIGGSFTVAKDPRGPTLGRGTRIILHMKNDSTKYLDLHVLRNIILRFSQFINYPIHLREERFETVDKKQNDENKEAQQPETPEVTHTWEQVNTNKPIWMRAKEDITENEYVEFFKALTKDYHEPLAYSHFAGEGEIEFKSIIYIPSPASVDPWNSYYSSKPEGIHLYSHRVLVTNHLDGLLPKWLTFLQGVINSDDLPLKVDREDVSQSRVMEVIAKKIVGKFFNLVDGLRKEHDETWKSYLDAKAANTTGVVEKPETTFINFWKGYNKFLKIGCMEDSDSKTRISKLLRFTSTKRQDEDFETTLNEYISRMPETQKVIYYITKDNVEAAMNSPHTQIYLKRGIEVLILTDSLYEPCFGELRSYEGKRLVSIEKTNAKLDLSDEEKLYQKKVTKAFLPLTQLWSKHLREHVAKVQVTHSLVNDPAAVTATTYGSSGYSDRVVRAQVFAKQDKHSLHQNRILEINPNHPLIKKMLELVKTAEDDPQIEQASKAIYEAALLGSGFVVDDPTMLSQKVFKLLQIETGLPAEVSVEDYVLSPEELADEQDAEVPENDSIADFSDFDVNEISPDSEADFQHAFDEFQGKAGKQDAENGKKELDDVDKDETEVDDVNKKEKELDDEDKDEKELHDGDKDEKELHDGDKDDKELHDGDKDEKELNDRDKDEKNLDDVNKDENEKRGTKTVEGKTKAQKLEETDNQQNDDSKNETEKKDGSDTTKDEL